MQEALVPYTMQDWLIPYTSTVLALGAVATLFLVQVLVLDLVSMRARHLPGSPVATDHDNLLFRVTRAHANTNETIAAFILLALFGMLSGAAPSWLAVSAWIYFAGRVAHMAFYYADLRTARSGAFVVALLGLVGMLLGGAGAWL